MARETELEKKIEGLLENAIAEGELPCANVLVLHKDKTVCYAQAGKDPGTGREIARDTIFRLYSQSKPITSAAVCLLMERGIIDMNDPVEKYLPGFANPKVLGKDGELIPAARSVKLMDLMGMCAGLCYPMEDAPGQYAAELFEKNQAAMDAGATDNQLAATRLKLREAQWYWDWVAAENGNGFHNPDKCMRISGESIDLAHQVIEEANALIKGSL